MDALHRGRPVLAGLAHLLLHTGVLQVAGKQQKVREGGEDTGGTDPALKQCAMCGV